MCQISDVTKLTDTAFETRTLLRHKLWKITNVFIVFSRNFDMKRSGSKGIIETDCYCKIRLLDDSEISCEFKVQVCA